MWKHSVEECDVQDRDALVRFRTVVEGWTELLHGDDEHSIAGQLSDMLWQDAAWRSANEARRFTRENGPSSAIAPILAAMLDRGYVGGQVLALSRLLETSDPRKPKQGVVSLRRVVDEITANSRLFTREVFVSHDGLPYEWESVRSAEYDRLAEETGPEGIAKLRWMSNSGPSAWAAAMGQHEIFDTLSGVAAPDRTRIDRISQDVFDRLTTALGDPVFADVMALRNKTIAHAADAFSRAQVADLRRGLKLDEFARAHYLLLGVFQAVSACLLYGHWRGGAVPVPQYDQFEHLEHSFVPASRLPDLRRFWHEHCEERDRWLTTAFREIIPERGPLS